MGSTDNQAATRAGISWTAVAISVLALVALGLSGYSAATLSTASAEVCFLLAQAAVISILIWQACEPFADTAQWLGNRFHIPGSVRGATLDAVASSMPELLTGIFFVLVAVLSADPSKLSATSEGFGSAVATAAGSAVYNMILIPAFCALIISFKRQSQPMIRVGREVIYRDGLWYVVCVMLLVLCLIQNQMHWWMGVGLLGIYVLYVLRLLLHTLHHRRMVKGVHRELRDDNPEDSSEQIVQRLSRQGIRTTPEAVQEQIDRLNGSGGPVRIDSAGLFFGCCRVSLTVPRALALILVSTLVAAAACYWLVEVTNATAEALSRLIGHQVPVFFVAVILAAAASSIPDTFLSIGAAVRGDDSGAVSNAFGSNIFDICVCMSLALLVNSAMVGWGPVALVEDGKPMAGLLDMCILLGALSVLTLLIMGHRRQLTRSKALVLTGLYGLFIAYAVVGSLGFSFSDWLIS